ncbi:MAG: hypothetical protein N2044_03935 [Cyclobacteriaceae bacterium]|nr:hypothetical protein [Cyclobacteriaceae bacterium]MCX7636979.1 hypothetical protein [Cyclobacteriaceae bacterium]MDW8330452.1 hypothetical protein [Cyclobacteriaceae bacterium]
MKKITLLSTFLVLVLAFTVRAQNQTPRADARQKAQRARIAEGRTSGEITPGEGAALNKQQRHIRRVERRSKADGQVSPAEKVRIERKQDRASRNIRRAKHNKRDRD